MASAHLKRASQQESLLACTGTMAGASSELGHTQHRQARLLCNVRSSLRIYSSICRRGFSWRTGTNHNDILQCSRCITLQLTSHTLSFCEPECGWCKASHASKQRASCSHAAKQRYCMSLAKGKASLGNDTRKTHCFPWHCCEGDTACGSQGCVQCLQML